MKLAFNILCLFATTITLGTHARADQASNFYYVLTTNSIATALQTKAGHLAASELQALRILNQKSDQSPIPVDHQAAEAALAEAFRAAFSQADNVEPETLRAGVSFDAPRDVYTFCPSGSEVKRTASPTSSPVDGSLEYSWNWSQCSSTADSHLVDGAIRIQDLWVSNVDHPTLTLLMVEDGQPGLKTRINLDINQMVSGNNFAKQISEKISP